MGPFLARSTAVDPLTNAHSGCGPQSHTTPITNSGLVCAGIALFCSLNGINFNFPNVAFLFMFCVAPGGSILAPRGSPPTSSAGSSVFIFGSLPNPWTLWERIAAKDPGGIMLGFHNDYDPTGESGTR